MVDRGLLAKPDLTFAEIDYSRQLWNRSSWQTAYRDLVVQSVDRNRAIYHWTRQREAEGLRTLVLVRSVAHGRLLEKMLKRPFIYGADDEAARQKVVTEFKRNNRSTMIASTIFDQGIDIPEIDALVIAGGGKSPVSTIQRIGRGMRPKVGKPNVLYVLDFADYGNKYLLKHTKERFSEYTDQECYDISSVDVGSLVKLA